MLLSDSKTCADIDECAEHNGGCAHECTNLDGGYQEIEFEIDTTYAKL